MKGRHARVAAPLCAGRGKAGVQAGMQAPIQAGVHAVVDCPQKESVPGLSRRLLPTSGTPPRTFPGSPDLQLPSAPARLPVSPGHILLKSYKSQQRRCAVFGGDEYFERNPCFYTAPLLSPSPLPRLKNLLLFKETPLNYFLLIVTSLPLALYPGILTAR